MPGFASVVCDTPGRQSVIRAPQAKMLRRVSRLRKLIQQGVQSAPSIAYETPPVSVPSTSYKQISNLPHDYATVKVVMPVRTVRNADPNPPQSATGGEKSSENIASGATTASAMQQGAQTGDHSGCCIIGKVRSCVHKLHVCYCSNLLDVSLGKAANGWARHPTEDLGEAILGCFCHSN